MEASKTRHFTILVAEDSEWDTLILKRAYALAGLPHAMLFVNDGQKAIDYLNGKPPYDNPDEFPVPDLLLLDLKMPKVDGFDVLKWMRAQTLTTPPVLVLSGSGLEKDQELAMQLGAREYHVKSGHMEAIVDFLKDIAERWLKESS